MAVDTAGRLRARRIRFNLFVAFAFTIMADPVSSVAYALEAALGSLDGDLGSLFPTMAVVVAIIALVAAGYHGLISRFPNGGGGPEALAAAFGEGWAFVPLGALLVDFTLTIAVSCAAGASALIAYAPELADGRVPIGLALVAMVGAGTLLGHRARIAFATATMVFAAATLVVLALGLGAEPAAGHPALAGDAALIPVLLALPLGMALATGVEAPSNAIAQLGQLDARGRRRFGQLTLWLMLTIVGTLTLGLAALAVRLGLGEPAADSTLLADVAREATGGGAVFGAFQAASALLLLAAAASSYLAGSGLLKALAAHGGAGEGLLPRRFRLVNGSYVPTWGVATLAALAAFLVIIAAGREQAIVHYYAAAVFASFLGALLAGTVLSYRDRRPLATLVAGAGTVAVALVLVLNLRRIDPLISLGVAAAVSAFLGRRWVARGRPGGVARIAT
jgi:Amino acid permease